MWSWHSCAQVGILHESTCAIKRKRYHLSETVKYLYSCIIGFYLWWLWWFIQEDQCKRETFHPASLWRLFWFGAWVSVSTWPHLHLLFCSLLLIIQRLLAFDYETPSGPARAALGQFLSWAPFYPFWPLSGDLWFAGCYSAHQSSPRPLRASLVVVIGGNDTLHAVDDCFLPGFDFFMWVIPCSQLSPEVCVDGDEQVGASTGSDLQGVISSATGLNSCLCWLEEETAV